MIRGVLERLLNVLKALEEKKAKEAIAEMRNPLAPPAHGRNQPRKDIATFLKNH